MLHEYSLMDGRISRDSGGTLPIDVYVLPDEQERRHLIDDLEIDEHTLISSIDPDETPRIEYEDNHTAIILKYPKNYSADDNFLFRVKSMGIFVFRDRVVVVVDDNVQLFTSARPARRIHSVQDVLLRILLQTIRHFESHLRVINMCSEEIENEINESSDNRSLLNMFTLEKGLVYYINALSGNRRVIERIRTNSAKFDFTEEHIEMIEDLAIENRQFLDQAQVYSQVLSGLMDARAAFINNNLNVMMKNKSTLLNLVAGLLEPTSGELLLDGEKITGPGQDRTVVFQEHALFPWLNVIENVMFGLKMAKLPKAEQEERALHYLEMMQLLDYKDYSIHQLSGGMRQRVALARALAIDSKMLLMDEPFSALDKQTSNRLRKELQDIWMQTHKTILFITHSVEEAIYLADRVVVLTPGKELRLIPIPLERPRYVYTPEFVALRHEILDYIQES